MRVILLNDVKNVGKKGQIVTVADGYGRNFLIRGGLAVIAGEKELAELENQKKKEAEKQAELKKQAEALKVEIEKLVLEFAVSAGAEGRVFGSVSTKQITEMLNRRYNIVVDKKKFESDSPLNTLGVHNVKVELYKGVVATVRVRLNAK